jgi:hypothetical protein
MNADTDDIIGPGYQRTRNGSQFVLVTIIEDIVHSDEEERTKEDGSTEVPLTSVLIGSYVDPETIDKGAWSRKMIKALKPIHMNEDELRIEPLRSDIQAAIRKRYEEDPHSEYFWKYVDEPTFLAYELQSYDLMEDEELKFKARDMTWVYIKEPLADDGEKMDTSEIPNSTTDDRATQEVVSDRFSEMDLGF